ncbi:mediator of RNA polymerase II transcription subunit 22 isoform X3 [Falco biarmicus]|uniref:mediator of RNA polymerase II transcription subunit 22 isoform X3 n=1 Tax=Falco rusticolus TaxID=120794 RepID=UPI0018867B07|nr:mediator of RNA polymerase II transcription subunit 22 isoform X3 [Falco rusticolus]XP_055575762.1 mediator of RNA polymerase II transcription subunit 22 isoform X3 [Falco cherrug]XP_055650150.1 mediator of RNA polymerase II transcription subunit 22 isoform X3 [Falco peregrinus]XP_056207892.1 mediator of RNA polymerase II transcription subunit 22 isoform X3 [Falco biarmicus]
MAQQRVLPQSKETLLQSYNKRLKDDVKSIMDNFTEIIKTAKVRAGESLMKLVSDLKQFLILNDFPSVNEAINQRNQQLRSLQEECDKKLIALRDEISIDLYELEEEYYSSSYSLCDSNDLPLCEAYWRQDFATLSPESLSMPLTAATAEQSVATSQSSTPSHPHVNGHGAGPTEHS